MEAFRCVLGSAMRKVCGKQSAEAMVALAPGRTVCSVRPKTSPCAFRRSIEKELTLLARIGALNQLDGIEHRRDALWQVERAGKLEGPLLRQTSEWLREDSDDTASAADEYRRASGRRLCRHRADGRQAPDGISAAGAAYAASSFGRGTADSPDGEFVRTAGCVIARQRPGTAKGFIFLSMEDETGIANVIVTPDLYERDRLVVTRSKFLLVEGPLQNQDGVIHVKASRLQSLSDQTLEVRSHDFH